MSRRLSTVVVLLLAAGTVRAAEWKTPDGVVSVTAPDEARFTVLETPPGLSVLWGSGDLKMRMVVGEMPNPQRFKLKQSGLEEGFLKEMNATFRNARLLNSVVEERTGYELFT